MLECISNKERGDLMEPAIRTSLPEGLVALTNADGTLRTLSLPDGRRGVVAVRADELSELAPPAEPPQDSDQLTALVHEYVLTKVLVPGEDQCSAWQTLQVQLLNGGTSIPSGELALRGVLDTQTRIVRLFAIIHHCDTFPPEVLREVQSLIKGEISRSGDFWPLHQMTPDKMHPMLVALHRISMETGPVMPLSDDARENSYCALFHAQFKAYRALHAWVCVLPATPIDLTPTGSLINETVLSADVPPWLTTPHLSPELRFAISDLVSAQLSGIKARADEFKTVWNLLFNQVNHHVSEYSEQMVKHLTPLSTEAKSLIRVVSGDPSAEKALKHLQESNFLRAYTALIDSGNTHHAERLAKAIRDYRSAVKHYVDTNRAFFDAAPQLFKELQAYTSSALDGFSSYFDTYKAIVLYLHDTPGEALETTFTGLTGNNLTRAILRAAEASWDIDRFAEVAVALAGSGAVHDIDYLVKMETQFGALSEQFRALVDPAQETLDRVVALHKDGPVVELVESRPTASCPGGAGMSTPPPVSPISVPDSPVPAPPPRALSFEEVEALLTHYDTTRLHPAARDAHRNTMLFMSDLLHHLRIFHTTPSINVPLDLISLLIQSGQMMEQMARAAAYHNGKRNNFKSHNILHLLKTGGVTPSMEELETCRMANRSEILARDIPRLGLGTRREGDAEDLLMKVYSCYRGEGDIEVVQAQVMRFVESVILTCDSMHRHLDIPPQSPPEMSAAFFSSLTPVPVESASESKAPDDELLIPPSEEIAAFAELLGRLSSIPRTYGRANRDIQGLILLGERILFEASREHSELLHLKTSTIEQLCSIFLEQLLRIVHNGGDLKGFDHNIIAMLRESPVTGTIDLRKPNQLIPFLKGLNVARHTARYPDTRSAGHASSAALKAARSKNGRTKTKACGTSGIVRSKHGADATNAYEKSVRLTTTTAERVIEFLCAAGS
ncbi:MAG: hypothetical protein SP1CHLAM54_06970 [Chlamydiia bacterium]|nr:hypothetical protein [Chlamydiia bacterium]MCH9615603.1 hypothetical protein [Chlamydiia bacterium]MCH9628994.1 hypothetical protein [Chlamydiia bacterium]